MPDNSTQGTGSPVDERFSSHQPIPGERDPGNLTHREPGAMGGQFSGADLPPQNRADLMDEQTAREHRKEGGGTT